VRPASVRQKSGSRQPDPPRKFIASHPLRMAWSKAEKAQRRAEAAWPYPKPRGREPRGANGVRKIWDKQQGGWHDDTRPLPMSTWPPLSLDSSKLPPPAAAAFAATTLETWVPAAPQSAEVQRREHASPSHPGRTRVHFTARTSTPRQRRVESSYLHDPEPEVPIDWSCFERHCANMDRKHRNAEAKRRSLLRLRPDAHAVYCERERARKACKA
jgi:hypothetical protein